MLPLYHQARQALFFPGGSPARACLPRPGGEFRSASFKLLLQADRWAVAARVGRRRGFSDAIEAIQLANSRSV